MAHFNFHYKSFPLSALEDIVQKSFEYQKNSESTIFIKNIGLIGLVSFFLFASNVISVYPHSLFNSEGQKIGNYYVQIATDPEIPTTGQEVKILLRISSNNGDVLADVPITIRLTTSVVENGKFISSEVDRIRAVVTNGHYEFNYLFNKAGNYIVYVDLEDIYYTGKTITYSFNLSTLNPFGYIFYSLISFASITPFVVIGVLFYKNKRDKKRRELMKEKVDKE